MATRPTLDEIIRAAQIQFDAGKRPLAFLLLGKGLADSPDWRQGALPLTNRRLPHRRR